MKGARPRKGGKKRPCAQAYDTHINKVKYNLKMHVQYLLYAHISSNMFNLESPRQLGSHCALDSGPMCPFNNPIIRWNHMVIMDLVYVVMGVGESPAAVGKGRCCCCCCLLFCLCDNKNHEDAFMQFDESKMMLVVLVLVHLHKNSRNSSRGS